MERFRNIFLKYFLSLPNRLYSIIRTNYYIAQQGEEEISGESNPGDVLAFIEYFENRYGKYHPKFCESDYLTCVEEAWCRQQYMVVYLHGDEHEDSDYFCTEILCSDLVVDFFQSQSNGSACEHSIKLWACNIGSGEGARASRALQEHTYPFIGVIMRGSTGRMYLMRRREGVVDAAELVAFIQTTIDECGGYIRALKKRWEDDRDIRRQQEEEYEAALVIDRAKEKIQILIDWRTRAAGRKEFDLLQRYVTVDNSNDNTYNGDNDQDGDVYIKLRVPTINHGNVERQYKFRSTDSIKLLFYWLLADPVAPIIFKMWMHAKCSNSNSLVSFLQCEPSQLEPPGQIVRWPRTRSDVDDPPTFNEIGLVAGVREVIFVTRGDEEDIVNGTAYQ